MLLFLNLVLYILSFISIWYGAGLIISSVDHFSKRLKISSFAISFFVLGLLTSIPEFAVGITSVAKNDPEIFVGNLLGGIPVIFLFIIPLLAIFGKGISLKNQLKTKNLLLALGVILAPSLFIIDSKVTNIEGIILILLYLMLFYFVEHKKGVLDGDNNHILDVRSYSVKNILDLVFGVAIAFVSSQFIVNGTIYFSNIFTISPFFISLIVLSIGTNLPELSLAIRSILSGKKEIAFGDYMGSAAANTLLFGVFTVLSQGEVVTGNNFILLFILIALGLGLFFLFTRVENKITPQKGFILLSIYICFLLVEIAKQQKLF